MNRRVLLRSLSTVGISSLAGCTGPLLFSKQAKLGWLAVHNWDESASHTFELRVNRDGTHVHGSTHEVEKMEENGNVVPGETADCTWENVAGEYVVSVRVDGGTWREFNLLEVTDGSPDCVTTDVQYGAQWGINEDDPLNIKVEELCDHLDSLSGSCPVDEPNSVRQQAID